jgi:hypothetical protein
MNVPLVILSPALLVAALLLCGAGWHPARGWQPRWPVYQDTPRENNISAATLYVVKML